MSKDNYSMRLKEIREKYGSSLKEAGPSLTKTTMSEFSKNSLSSYERPSRPNYESRSKQASFTLGSTSSKINLGHTDKYTRDSRNESVSSNLQSNYEYHERPTTSTNLYSQKYDKYDYLKNPSNDTLNNHSSSSSLLKAKTRD